MDAQGFVKTGSDLTPPESVFCKGNGSYSEGLDFCNIGDKIGGLF